MSKAKKAFEIVKNNPIPVGLALSAVLYVAVNVADRDAVSDFYTDVKTDICELTDGALFVEHCSHER